MKGEGYDWVMGPVRIVAVDPPSVAQKDGSVRNGAMPNPRALDPAAKRIRCTTRDWDCTVLRKSKPVPGAPDLAQVARYFERPWIDHMVALWKLEDNAPAENMPRVGTEVCRMVEEGSLFLNLDLPDSNKERPLTRFVQAGIDLYGVVTTGDFGKTAYPSAGSHRSGRKWPIIFAGVVLYDEGSVRTCRWLRHVLPSLRRLALTRVWPPAGWPIAGTGCRTAAPWEATSSCRCAFRAAA